MAVVAWLMLLANAQAGTFLGMHQVTGSPPHMSHSQEAPVPGIRDPGCTTCLHGLHGAGQCHCAACTCVVLQPSSVPLPRSSVLGLAYATAPSRPMLHRRTAPPLRPPSA